MTQPMGLHVLGPILTLAANPPSSYPSYFGTIISILPKQFVCLGSTPLKYCNHFCYHSGAQILHYV